MYIAILVFMTIISIIFCCKRDYKLDKIMIISLIVVLTLIEGFRYDVGVDYVSYESHFYNQTFPMLPEILYWFICNLIYKLDLKFYIVTLLISIIKNIFIYFGLKKRGLGPVYILIAILIYISDVWLVSFNLMRQSVAVAIFFYASIYIEKRDIKKYMFYILIAMGFHKSSYLLIPMYFIKYINLDIIKYLILLFLCYIVVGKGMAQEILNWITTGMKGYESYHGTEHIFAGDTNILSIGVLIKVIVSIVVRIIVNKNIDKDKKMEVNYYLYGRIFNVLSISSYIFDRIGIYFSIFSIFAIPYSLSKINNKDKRYFISIVIIFCIVLLYIKTAMFSPLETKLEYRSIFNIY